MRLWIDRKEVASMLTTRRPFADLDPAFAPGVSVGNVQNDQGPHNQPLDGVVADLRLYATALTPADIDDGMPPWAKEERGRREGSWQTAKR